MVSFVRQSNRQYFSDPFKWWQRRRLWNVYDGIYRLAANHADVHYDWIRRNIPFDRISRFFSIGPGRGQLELELCQRFSADFGYVDSSRPHCDYLEKSASRRELSHHILERHTGGYQRYTPVRKYDLMLSIHSWYAFHFDERILTKTMHALNSGGSLVISVSSGQDFFCRECLRRPMFTAEGLSDWVDSLGVRHEYHAIEQQIPTKLLVDGGRVTKVGKGVVSFLKGKSWYFLDADIRRDIVGRLRSIEGQPSVNRVRTRRWQS